MSDPKRPINESTLSLNLNEQSHALVRELAMASRKMSVYGPGHPLADKAAEKPFFYFGNIYRYKSIVNLNIQRGQLYLLNICMKDTPFNTQIIQALQVIDVNAITFHRRMTIREFTYFIQSLVDRAMVYDTSFNLGRHLRDQKIDSIEINTEYSFELFENSKQYRGEVDADFSVKRMALDQLGSEILPLGRMLAKKLNNLSEYGVDFDPDIIAYILPEKLASFPANKVHETLKVLADKLSSMPGGTEETERISSDYMALFKLVDFHPERQVILDNLDQAPMTTANHNQELISNDGSMSQTGTIKVESSKRIDDLTEQLFSEDNRALNTIEFSDSFSRLLRTGQQPKAEKVIAGLINQMSGLDPNSRQKALNLSVAILQKLDSISEEVILIISVETVVKILNNHSETYEFSDFIWHLFDICHKGQRYELMARLTNVMATRRSMIDDVTVYDSMAVKKAFENIGSRETIEKLIDRLVATSQEQTHYLKSILVGIGSEETALALSRIISHPVRQVRKLTLKVLADLGKASLKVFSQLLSDEVMFQREQGRHELPNAKWYIIRNSIFVLASLEDEQGIPALRSRISDKDVRVRREIISALERIGGEEAIDCLTLMADDQLQEIRESAIIGIGLIGNHTSVPILVDIGKRHPTEAAKIVRSIGKLGGDTAGNILSELLEHPDEMVKMANGSVSRDEMRIAVIRALEEIGDKEAIEKIKAFKKGQSSAAKLLFKSSSVNKVIAEVLDKY